MHKNHIKAQSLQNICQTARGNTNLKAEWSCTTSNHKKNFMLVVCYSLKLIFATLSNIYSLPNAYEIFQNSKPQTKSWKLSVETDPMLVLLGTAA